MIRKLRGHIDTLELTEAIVDVGGVGFRLAIPLSTRQALAEAPRHEPVSLWVHTRVREDAIELFGFATLEELRVFELLLQASGVGPRLALSALSTFEPQRLLGALAASDIDALQRVPGIGRRTAERLCVELAEKARDLVGAEGADEVTAAAGRAARLDGARHPGSRDAVEALISLGYSRAEALKAVRTALRRVPPDASLETLLKAALAAAAGSGYPD